MNGWKAFVTSLHNRHDEGSSTTVFVGSMRVNRSAAIKTMAATPHTGTL